MSDNLYGDWYGYTDAGAGSSGSDFYGFDFTSPQTNDFFAYFQPAQQSGGSSDWYGGTGAGAAVSSNPIMEILSNAKTFFGEMDPKVQSTLLSLGGSFLAGAMGAKRADQIAKNGKMTAEASMMNAQSAQKLADSKVAMQQKSQMAGTTFGKPRAGGIMSLPYKNKLAERQANPGGSGLIGAA